MMAEKHAENKLLLLVAGAKGAIGTTLAVVAALLKSEPEKILPYLTTQSPSLSPFISREIQMAGWDVSADPFSLSLKKHGVLPDTICTMPSLCLDDIPIKAAPPQQLTLGEQAEQIRGDIEQFRAGHPDSRPVLVNLLPAGPRHDLSGLTSRKALLASPPSRFLPDMAYVMGALTAGVPVVNFTPNEVEIPLIVSEAVCRKIPISGRDGKTGQTYFKMVLASALRARNLTVNGWYSLNILGNADGRNLMDPERAAAKLDHKTSLLDEILGYPVGAQYDGPSHKVHIDYYPPRGDAKEAWDVIDFEGIMGMPMSLRLNLQGRDSILAAPLVLDLCRWMDVLQQTGRVGLIPELAFYYKKGLGAENLFTFQDQTAALEKLGKEVAAFYR